MSKATEVRLVDGRFQMVEVDEEIREITPQVQAAIGSLQEGRPDPERDRARRIAFIAWLTENPRDADRVLDDLDRYGVVFEHEYMFED